MRTQHYAIGVAAPLFVRRRIVRDKNTTGVVYGVACSAACAAVCGALVCVSRRAYALGRMSATSATAAAAAAVASIGLRQVAAPLALPSMAALSLSTLSVHTRGG